MKKAWGERDPSKPADALVEVPSVGERPSRVVTYATLSEIIEPRAQELLELIRAEIVRSGCEKLLGAGMVLTGGGAKLGGLAGYAEPIFGMPVRVAIPSGLEAMGEILPDPAFATVVGLVVHGYRSRLLRDAKESTGFFGKLWNKLK